MIHWPSAPCSWALTHGLRVPEDIAIAGFDNIEFAEHAVIPITSVNYAIDEVSTTAVDRLLGLIAAADALPEPQITQFAPDLVVRQSTDRLSRHQRGPHCAKGFNTPVTRT